MYRRPEIIRAVVFANSTKLPEGVLQACAKALETLRKTDRTCFPVRISQDKMIEQMIEGLPPDGDPQTIHAGKI